MSICPYLLTLIEHKIRLFWSGEIGRGSFWERVEHAHSPFSFSDDGDEGGGALGGRTFAGDGRFDLLRVYLLVAARGKVVS